MGAAILTNWIETLYRELDEWNYDGVEATFWWRDDDAQSASQALAQMLDLARQYDAPLGLGVIPKGMDDKLVAWVRRWSAVAVLQHGFAHHNHAPPDEKKMELGSHRPPAVVHRELAEGFKILADAFGTRFLPVLVPPWNRMATPLLAGLGQTGFAGLSTFGPRPERELAAGLRVVNTHVDLIDWKKGRAFVGAPRAVEAMVAHLKARRFGDVDSSEPTGLLSHHRVHDVPCQRFLARLLAALDEHPAARWLSPAAVFGAMRD